MQGWCNLLCYGCAGSIENSPERRSTTASARVTKLLYEQSGALHFAPREYSRKNGAALNLRISMSNHRVMVMAAALMLSLSTNAQRVSGDSQIESVATQLSRVEAAMSKLAPFQLLGCWNRARISPLIGLTESESKGVQAAPYDPQDSTWLSLVQPGDLLISVDGEEIKLGAKGGGLIAGKARVPAFRQLRSHGRSYVEVYKNSEGREISVVNPVRLECSASDISVTDGKSDRAGSRSFVGHLDYYGLNISSTRLALLSDDELLAFLAWNHAFMSLRHETNADVWEFVTLIGNGRPSMAFVSASSHLDAFNPIRLSWL